MASFTSTFPFLALLNSIRSHHAIPKHSHTLAARLHVPDFPNLSFISKGSTMKARSYRERAGAKYLLHINQAAVTLLNDCFFVQRLEGSTRPDVPKSSVKALPQSKDSSTGWQQGLQNHRDLYATRGDPTQASLSHCHFHLHPASLASCLPVPHIVGSLF